MNNEQIELAKETLTGDIRDFLLDRLRHMPRAWPEMTESQQQTQIDAATSAALRLVERAVRIIAENGRKVVEAELGKITIDKGCKAEIKFNAMYANELIDAQGLPILIVSGSKEDYVGEKAPVYPDPDQREMFNQEYQEADGAGVPDPITEESRLLEAPDETVEVEYEEIPENNKESENPSEDEEENGGENTMRYTLLRDEQIWAGDALEVMKAYGTKVAPTDLAVLLGALMTGNKDRRTSEGDLTCLAWTASADNGYAFIVYFNGAEDCVKPTGRRVGARPALLASETHKIHPRCEKNSLLLNGKNLRIAEWGEYPQTVISKELEIKLERAFYKGGLTITGKKYTFDSSDSNYFEPYEHMEYEFEGKKYIRLEARPADSDSVLSTGEKVEEGRDYWVEVQPVEWLVDPSGIWVAKKALFAGIQFDTEKEYYGNFDKTFMNKYLNEYFAKELREESYE